MFKWFLGAPTFLRCALAGRLRIAMATFPQVHVSWCECIRSSVPITIASDQAKASASCCRFLIYAPHASQNICSFAPCAMLQNQASGTWHCSFTCAPGQAVFVAALRVACSDPRLMHCTLSSAGSSPKRQLAIEAQQQKGRKRPLAPHMARVRWPAQQRALDLWPFTQTTTSPASGSTTTASRPCQH